MNPPGSTRARPLLGLLLLFVGSLFACSVWLALNRIYQVDECMNLFMARILATGQAAKFFTNASLFLIGPLSWISRHASHAVEMFADARLVFLLVFWLNLGLLAAIVSRRFFSVRGWIALAAAATLAPLWDYGFEIRHDNLILTCMLLIWWAAGVPPLGARSYLISGAATVVALFIAVKAVVYVVPLAGALILFPPPGHQKPRWQLIV